MSGHGDPHDAAHDHDEAHGSDQHAPPPPQEPATPLWFTLLGVAIFLVAGLLLIASGPEAKTTAELTAAPSADAPSPAAAPPAPPAR